MKDLRHRSTNGEPGDLYSSIDRLFVDLNIPGGESASLKVYNMLGQNVWQTSLSGNGYHELDISVSPGLYIAVLSSSEGTIKKKIHLSGK